MFWELDFSRSLFATKLTPVKAGEARPWHISLFGGLMVTRQGSGESRVRSKKAGGVLGYLAYFRGQAFSREALADQYWPECDPETARQNLRAALAILRRQLEGKGEEGALLCADREGVWLNSDAVSTDVGCFFELIEAAKSTSGPERLALFNEAIALVRGPLLPGHEGLWILPQQFHLDEEVAQAAVRAVETACELGDYDHAVRIGKSALAKWPLREDVHIAVIKAHALAGRNAEAVQQYEELERLLDEHWGEAPSAQASQVLDNLPTPGAVHQPVATVHVPARFSSFIGRTEELAELQTAVTQHRLVTVLGPGGCGKTRLGIEAARAMGAAFGGRVWYVPLADIEDGTLVPLEVRRALGLEASPRSDAFAQVSGFVGQTRAVLVLDNFEQLVDGGASVVSRLLEECPQLVCVVTSRRALSVEGEQLLPIRPLPIPPRGASVSELEACGSVQLFVDRAQAARPDFRLSGTTAEVVAELCRRLDGLPLAIELAASRVSTMSPAQILGKIGQTAAFLTSRLQTTPERHRSLRATVEWSVRLLPDATKRVFRRASVLRGAWTAETIGALCPDQAVEEDLQTLIDSSLIQSELRSDEVVFTMLEAVREQALGLLAESGEEQETRKLHAEAFANLVAELAIGLHGMEQGRVADRIELELDNLREATAWARSQSECAESALSLAGSIRSFFGFRGHFEGWFEAVQALLALPYCGPPEARITACLCCGGLGFYHADFSASKAAYEEARELAMAHGLHGLLTEAVFGVGVAHRALGDFDGAFARYEEALELGKTTSVPHVTCKIHYNIGLLAEFLDRFAEAKSHYEASLKIAETVLDKRVMARDRDGLGRCALHEGSPEAAVLHHEAARRLMAEVGDRNGENEVIGNIALMELTLGHHEKALSLFAETLVLLWQMQNVWELRSNVAYLAASAAELGRLDLVPDAVAIVRCLDDALGIEMRQADRDALDRAIGRLAGRVSEEELGEALAKAKARLGLSIESLAERAIR